MIEWKLMIGTLLIIEAITLFLRFGINKESKDYNLRRMNNKWKKRKIHWHHFFIGLAIIPLSFLFSGFSGTFLFNIGLGVFFSDMVHHFVILALFVGNPEFYLIYKNSDLCKNNIKRRIIKNFVKEI